MRNIVMKIGYMGTKYNGFQKQNDIDNTIQGLIESGLSKAFKEDVKIIGASRTDGGVHAKGQIIQFKEVKEIALSKYVYILNNYLPEDIRAYSACIMEGDLDFHVRYSSIGKKYIYRVDNNRVPSLMYLPFSLHYPYDIDISKMEVALRTIIGEHDFTAFASRFSNRKNMVRTVYKASLKKYDNGIIEIIVEGNGFLHNMVRIIVGSLLDIGRGIYDTDIFLKAYKDRDRKKLGKTAKAGGLMLDEIYYKEVLFDD